MFPTLGPLPQPGQPIAVVAVVEEARAFADRIPVVLSGVGKISAAAATTWAALVHRPSVILNLGTAGALRPDVVPGRVHEIGTVLQHDLNGRAIAALVGDDPAVPLALGGGGTVLATGDRFISTPADRDALAVIAHLVDMEGYAVAWAAGRLGVAVRLAKVVSDDAGHGAARSWSAALGAASELLGRWVDDVLS